MRAASNLTIYEFSNGTWTDKERVYVTRSLRHKTSSGGPAKLLWDTELKTYADTYLTKLRSLYSTSSSVAPAAVGVPAMPLFFISTKGNPLDESRASNRLAQMGKQVAPQLKGTLKSSRLRKSIVSLQREQTSAAGSKTQLAKQMGHSLETAEKYYNIETEAESDARVQRLIDRLTHGTVPPVDPRLPPLGESDEPHTHKDKDKEKREKERKESGEKKSGEKKSGEKESTEKGEGGEKGGEDDDQSSHNSSTLMDDIPARKRHELLNVFGDNMLTGRIILKPVVQARMSKNTLLKDVDPDTAVRFLEKEKAKPVSGVEKAKVWVGSSDFNRPTSSASMSSATDGRLFTGLQTILIENVMESLPPNASGKKCLEAIAKDARCQEQYISQRFTEQQLKDKVKTIRRKAARKAEKFRF